MIPILLLAIQVYSTEYRMVEPHEICINNVVGHYDLTEKILCIPADTIFIDGFE